MFTKNALNEVTYENGLLLDFYEENTKTKNDIDYVYKHLIPKEDYQKFWNNYRNRYFDLKNKYKEGYHIVRNEW